MARFTRIQVVQKMYETGMIPVFYNKDIELVKNVIKACYVGGARVFEFTNRGDYAHEVFAELNKYAASEFPEMIMGVGSIIDAGTASIYIQLGANFIVSPVLNEDMAKVCNRRKIAWSPGCGSVSEISKAEELGVEVVKIFPANQVGGTEFVAAVKGPMPWSNIMPSSGVEPTEESLSTWFKAGAYCVGMGSQLFTKKIIEENNFGELTENVRNTLSIIQKLRG